MLQHYAVAQIKALGYWTVIAWTHEAVVDLEVNQAYLACLLIAHFQRVEGSDAMRTAKEDGAVGEQARRSVAEFIASQSVCTIIVGEFFCTDIVFAHSVLSAHPDIALAVNLYTCNVLAWRALDVLKCLQLRVIAEQSVADGAYPEPSVVTFSQSAWQEGVAYDAAAHHRIGDDRKSLFLCLAVDVAQSELAFECGKSSVRQLFHAGQIAEGVAEQMMLCKPRCFLALREVGIAETACPYRAVLVFVEYDCYWQVVVVEQFYLFSFDAKLQQTPRSQRNPKVAIAVNKNHVVSVAEGVGCLNFVDIDYIFGVDVSKMLSREVVGIDACALSRNPKSLLLIDSHRCHHLLAHGIDQWSMAVEALARHLDACAALP